MAKEPRLLTSRQRARSMAPGLAKRGSFGDGDKGWRVRTTEKGYWAGWGTKVLEDHYPYFC